MSVCFLWYQLTYFLSADSYFAWETVLRAFEIRSIALSVIPFEDKLCLILRGGSRAAATSKMEQFVIIVNSWKRLTIITKRSVLDVAAGLDPPLILPMLPVSVTSSDLENAFSLRNWIKFLDDLVKELGSW